MGKNKSWVSRADGETERIEACFSGLAYAPHSHDTYTLALTTQGVQSFNYRGELRHSLPGEVVILHPDETHDGQAGTCLLYTSPSPRDLSTSRMPSSA